MSGGGGGLELRDLLHTKASRTIFDEETGIDPKPLLGDTSADQQKPGHFLDGSASEGAPTDGGKPPGDSSAPSVPFKELFRFADRTDRILMGVAIVAAAADGVTYPSFSFLFAGLLDSFFNPSGLVASVEKYALYLFAIGVGSFVVGTLRTSCSMIAAERQGVKLRTAYFTSLLRQDAGYYDTHRTGEVASRMSEDVMVALDGIGEKLTGALSSVGTFTMSLVLGFVRGPDLSGVVMAFVPAIAILGAVFAAGLTKWQKAEQDAYAAAGAAAAEAISSIRTVAAYGGERAESRRYATFLRRAEAVGTKKGFAMGATVGAIFAVLQGSYGVALWFGSRKILDSRLADPTCRYDPTHPGCYTGGTVINCFFAIITAAFALAGVVPFLGTAASACAAAGRIYEVIDRVPPIDTEDTQGGLQPDEASVQGRIEFRGVTFAYPSRPDQPVLRDFSIVIEPGSTVGLCGGSGSGKSTIVALLQRLYDPQAGAIYLDGTDIRRLNVQWLRRQLGLVSQEPTLFAVSIRDNIALGRAHSAVAPTSQEVEEAAQAANAHGFVTKLPAGYDTMVGERGAQLSGGQKQRVAIARAILRNPRILLLDEATSALDTASERVVQAAIDRLLAGEAAGPNAHKGGPTAKRTSLIIAHRLSTIAGADRILVLQQGVLVEDGSHTELMAVPGGRYRGLREMQGLGAGAGKADGGGAAHLTVNTSSDRAVEEELPSGYAGGDPSWPGSRDSSYTVSSSSRGADVPGPVSASSPVAFLGLTTPHPDPLEPPASSSSSASRGDSARFGFVPHVAAGGGGLGNYASLPTEEEEEDAAVVAAAAAAAAAGSKKRKPAVKAAKTGGGDDDDEDGASGAFPVIPMSRVWALNRPEWGIIAVAMVAAGANGAVQPLFSILFSRMVAAFYNPDDAVVADRTSFYGLMFGVIGAGVFLANFLQIGLFVYSGEKLTGRLRVAVYRSLLRQEVAFFDHPTNSTGRLTTRLSTDAGLVKATTGDRLGRVVQAGASLVTGVVIAFTASWRLSLISLGVMPVIVGVQVLQMKAVSRLTDTSDAEDAGHVAVEATSGIRTVTAFGLQAHMRALFAAALQKELALTTRRAAAAGLGTGASSFVMFSSYSAVFFAGAQLINANLLGFQDMLQTFFAVVMAAQGIGMASSFQIDRGKAEKATRSIFGLIDRASAIDPMQGEGEGQGLSSSGAPPSSHDSRSALYSSDPSVDVDPPLPELRCSGRIEFRNVHFSYPTRPDQPVLRGVTITAEPGQVVALVGPSGSGKSSLIALLQRFYDPTGGGVFLDGTDIRTLPPHALRATMALVAQEPALWNDSLAYNIEYGRPTGKPEPGRGVPVDAAPGWAGSGVGPAPRDAPVAPDVAQAARDANAADFIGGFVHGYATAAGDRGSQLSGGQRQRVAIARAILRNPRILLLDEATSALDSQSERVVQAALDRLLAESHGGQRTSLVVAHRLSTIRNADVIVVLQDGRVVEQGTHDDLMARGPGGVYANLARAQEGQH